MSIKNIQIEVPAEVHKKIKIACVHKDMKLNALIRVLIYNYLYEMPKPIQEIIEERAGEFNMESAFEYLDQLTGKELGDYSQDSRENLTKKQKRDSKSPEFAQFEADFPG